MSDTGGRSVAPGAELLSLWRRLSALPAGDRLFTRALTARVPYSGSTGAIVRALEPGRAIVELRERRLVRNHLRSVHAVALVNIGELASGLALITALPPDVRGIVVRLEADYHRKARGVLVADCSVEPPVVQSDIEHAVEAPIVDAEGEVVCVVRALWRLSRS